MAISFLSAQPMHPKDEEKMKVQSVSMCTLLPQVFIRRSGYFDISWKRQADGRRVRSRTILTSGKDIKSVVDGAASVPDGVSPVEFQRFYHLLESQSFEEVEAKTLELVKNGELSEGLLQAALATLEQAQRKQDERVLPTLSGLCNYLIEVYQQNNVPRALALVDGFVQLIRSDRDAETNRSVVKDAMTARLLDEDAEIGVAEFLSSVEKYLAAMEEQDNEFEEGYSRLVEEGGMTDAQKDQFDQMRHLRAEAKGHMRLVRAIAGELVV